MDSERIDQLVAAADSTPQTPTVRHSASAMMQKRGFNPFEKMMDLAEKMEKFDDDQEIPVFAEKRMKLYMALAKYYAPQPKSIDININSDTRAPIQVINFGDLYQQREHLIPQQSRYEGPTLAGAIEAEFNEVDDE